MDTPKQIPPVLLTNYKIALERERREGEVAPVGMNSIEDEFTKGLITRRLIRANRERFNQRRRVI